ncbi:MAG: hypothetical protein AAGA80_05290 [Cyanobacteria bacterium P01_F01_bin.143]
MILKVWQWGTEIGACYHYGSYIDITPTLTNELSKYGLDLEAFMVEHGISYELIKPGKQQTLKLRPDLHLGIKWSGWWRPNSGTINGHYFCYHRNSQGDYIKLVHNNQIYHNPSMAPTPDQLKPYFDKIWLELEETEYIRFPREISLGSKVANYLPEGFKAYKTDDDDQCRVARNTHKYCYIKRWRDCEWYVSPTDNYQLMSKKTDSMKSAISEALKMINETKR